jgi:hypothetical protein
MSLYWGFPYESFQEPLTFQELILLTLPVQMFTTTLCRETQSFAYHNRSL